MLLGNVGIVLGIYVICYILGYPLKCFWLSSNSRYDCIITPWLGFCAGMVIMYYLGWFGISVQAASFGLVLFFLCLDIILYIKIRTYPYFSRKAIIIVLGILVLCAVFLTLPNYIFNYNNFPLILGNNDFVIYSAISNALKNNSIKSLVYNENLQGIMKLWISGSQSRLLCCWIAFCSAFFKVNIFAATSYISVYAYFMIIVSFLALMDRYSHGRSSKIIAMIFMLFNYNFLYLFYQGFIAQLIAVGLMIMISFIILDIYDKYSLKNSSVLAILIIGLAMSYGEMMPVIVMPMVIWCVFELIFTKGKAVIVLKNYISAALLVLILYGRAYITVLGMLNTSRMAQVGWEIEAGYLWQGIGIYNVFKKDLFGTQSWSVPALVVSSMIAITVMLYMIWKKRNDVKYRVLGIFGIVNTGLYAMFLTMYDLYKSYKALVNMSYVFILILLLVLFDDRVKNNARKLIKILRSIALSVIFFLIVTSGLTTYFQVIALGECIGEGKYAIGGVVGEGHKKLGEVVKEYSGEKFYLSGNNYWNCIAALTLLEQEDVVIMDNSEVYWWNSKETDPLPIEPNEEIIYIDSSLIREPINLEGEIIEEDEYYTVKKVSTDYPICLNRMQMGLNRIIQYTVDNQVICGRKFLYNDTSLLFHSGKSQEKNIYVELWNTFGEDNKIEIIKPDGQTVQYDLEAGERREFILENVWLEEDKENVFQFKIENCELYLLNFSFFENQQTNLYVEQIGHNIGKYKWLSMKGLWECVNEKFGVAPLNEEQMVCELELSIDMAEISDSSNNNIDGYVYITNKSGGIIALTRGKTPINIGIQLCDKEGNVINHDLERIPVEKLLWFNNQKIRIEYDISIDPDGIEDGYSLRFIPIQEGVAWYPDNIESNYAYLLLKKDD